MLAPPILVAVLGRLLGAMGETPALIPLPSSPTVRSPIKDEDNDEDRYARLCSFGAYFVLDPDGL